VAVILARKHRLEGRAYDQAIDQERNLVERLFQTLKHYRSIAMLFLVATIIWLE
jgi:transposase